MSLLELQRNCTFVLGIFYKITIKQHFFTNKIMVFCCRTRITAGAGSGTGVLRGRNAVPASTGQAVRSLLFEQTIVLAPDPRPQRALPRGAGPSPRASPLQKACGCWPSQPASRQTPREAVLQLHPLSSQQAWRVRPISQRGCWGLERWTPAPLSA